MAVGLELPPPLSRGDSVRIVASSGDFDRQRFAAGIARIEAAGLKPEFDEGVFARHRYLAGDDPRRLKELQAAIDTPDAGALWLARGGYGITRLLRSLDPAAVAKRPKWLIGFSDATGLHGLWQRAGLASLHGPNVTTVDGWGNQARESVWRALFEGRGATLSGSVWHGSGNVQGTLAGGNITVLAAMVGTGTLPSFAGAVVFLEDVGERPYRLDRSLTQLIQSAAFDGVVGFAIGQLTGCVDPQEADYDAAGVVAEILHAHSPDAPILGDLPVGHDPSSHPLVFGVTATVDCSAAELRHG